MDARVPATPSVSHMYREYQLRGALARCFESTKSPERSHMHREHQDHRV